MKNPFVLICTNPSITSNGPEMITSVSSMTLIFHRLVCRLPKSKVDKAARLG